ncbi:MAG: 16S rRNA (guanine(966)-N(2))-methyltransferase RsmD [Proteobacteria bacterium]|nr:16S rRNA (guanine(966)-N(2))-methyltransferase RsmD [Pseudomonadota bacterium]MYJ95887.1 16S rRNA (guanine(966)-N(2))-methyltransferase RsmD [Pseudomonadota bacterium]
MQSRRRTKSTGVRIVGGRWRGRRLVIPSGTEVRPTPDRVRETLFNWLAPSLPGAQCLDLFAGTGVLGLEALSRGAAGTTFVEHDALLVRALEDSICTLAAEARVFHEDAMGFLASRPRRPFDVVFADPPYATGLAQVLAKLASWLASGHLVYVERPVKRGGDSLGDAVAAVPGVQLLKQGTAARVAFGLLRLADPE